MTIPEAFAAAVAHHQAGNLSAAETLYRQILAAKPDDVGALSNLGLIAKRDEAMTLLKRAVAIRPDHVEAVINLGHILKDHGDIDEAIATYERALALSPNHPLIHFGLGSALQTQGKLEAAIAHYERAVYLKPDFIAALHSLGAARDDPNKPNAEAAKYLRWALSLDPKLTDANIRMVRLLESEGRLAEAKSFGDRIPRPLPFLTDAAPEPRRTVLLPSVLGPGNVPLHSLLPKQTTTFIRWEVDYATEAQAEDLPPHDILFNGVGNADLADPSFELLNRLHYRKKMLNAPEAVVRTRRDRLPQLLAGIPDVVAPPVLRLRRDEVININLTARLAADGISCPVLMRPIVLHSGGGMVLCETPRHLIELKFPDADAFYFIPFHDYRSADGFYRKFRMIYVDRKPFAYHLAISDKWLVHYFSANMNSGPWKKEEENRFRADPAGFLGAPAMAAIEAIGQRLNLDFAGIDFAVLPDGKVLVFEANATMSVFHPETDPEGKYKHAAAIVSAFDAMLDKNQP